MQPVFRAITRRQKETKRERKRKKEQKSVYGHH